MEKVIKIGGQDIRLVANALTPVILKEELGTDVLSEITALQNTTDDAESKSIMLFQKIAFVMAKQGNPDMHMNYYDWLSQFEMMDLYTALPEVVELWGKNTQTASVPKKKYRHQRES